jgi:hypothetical protein
MTVLNQVATWWFRKRIHQMELFMRYPHDVQQEVLQRLLQHAQDTRWGQTYDYRHIKDPESFSRNVPLSTYEDLTPWIQSMMQGEVSVLWPGEIKWFAKSSGTTNDRSKYIPVSEEALQDCHYKGAKDLLSVYCNLRPEAALFEGKCLTIGGSQAINPLNTQSFTGDLSALLMHNQPFWANMVRTPDLEIALMDDWEPKIQRIIEETRHEVVTNMAGVPSWLLLLCRRMLEFTGKSNMLEIWPRMEVYFHGGVGFHPYRNQFKALFPSDAVWYLETYNASEGFLGLANEAHTDEMLLMLDYGIYYEFIPLEDLHESSPSAIPLHQVVVGRSYAVVISTNSGLWRYQIGDTITFTSSSPYKFRILGRTRSFINAFGEELMAENAETAIARAAQSCRAEIRDYTAAPMFLDQGHVGLHQWLIEFESPPDELARFSQILDEELRKINSDYDAKRHKNLALMEPQIIALPDGTFYKWLQSRNKLGGQHKVPRLVNHREIADSVLALLQRPTGQHNPI